MIASNSDGECTILNRGQIKFITSGFVTELNRRVKVADHQLWGSQCLLNNVQAEIETYREYLKIGVDILITNTYQASIEGFVEHLGVTESEAYDLFKQSVDHCKEAVRLAKEAGTIDENKEILIAGSMGSFGAYLSDGSEYTGAFMYKYSEDDIEKRHRPKVKALVEAGVDLLAFETIPTVMEAKIFVKLLSEYPNMRAWVSFSAKDEHHTGYGEKFCEVASATWLLNPTQLVAVGVNCISGNIATELISSLKNIPIIVYPNCGRVWNAKKKEWMKSKNEQHFYDDLIQKWCDMGVKYVGLCCNSSMESRSRVGRIIGEHNKSKLYE